jgi:hypothetical protein
MNAADSWCEVKRYTPEMKQVWDRFIAAAKNGSFLFLRDYMDYHNDRFDDHSLMFWIEGRLMACLPANRVGATLHSHQGLTYGGIMMCEDIRLHQAHAIAKGLRRHMIADALIELVYRPSPHIYHRLPSEEDIEALASLGARVAGTKAVCALRLDRQPSVSENRRRDLALFRTTGHVVRRSFAFREFMAFVADRLRERHGGKPVHSGEEIERLALRFPEHIQLYAVERGSGFAAGWIVYRNAECAKLQYVAHDVWAMGNGAGTAIAHYVLSEVLPPGSWFEFGHSVQPSGAINEGVHAFKESLGGRTIQVREYALTVGRA